MPWHTSHAQHESQRSRDPNRGDYKGHCAMQKLENNWSQRMHVHRWDGNAELDQRILVSQGRRQWEDGHYWSPVLGVAQSEWVRQDLWFLYSQLYEKLPSFDASRAEQMWEHDWFPLWSYYQLETCAMIEVPWHQYDKELQTRTTRGV